MSASIGVTIILVLYVALMGVTFYACVIADPAKSPLALFMSHTLPNEFMKLAGKIVGQKGVKIIEIFMEKLLAIIYLTVVCGGFSLLWCHAYPWIRESDHVPNYHLTLGYVVFFFALATWRWTMTTSPGIITRETIQFHDHFPYDDLLYVEGRMDRKKGLPRLPRSKFDRLKHHEHVARFDHYCGWVAGTIGEENYRIFLLFVLTQFAMCCYGSHVMIKLFMGEIEDKKLFEVTFFDRQTGQEYEADKWVIFQYLFHRHMYEAGVLAIMFVMAIALFFFLAYHFYITSKGMTTNEDFKFKQVKKWHKEQVKKYEEYKKQQAQKGDDGAKEDQTDKKQQKPPVPDGDVTCTGGKEENTKDGSDQSQDPPVVEHPGPLPENIYNRGFVENWKEVLFPISLRRKAEAAKKANKSL